MDELLAKVKSYLDIWIAFLTRYDLLKIGSLPQKLDKPELKKAISIFECYAL